MGLTPEELAQKIKDAQQRQSQKPGSSDLEKEGMDSGLAMAARAATDMVASIIVGAFLGYWLDKWLDTSPLFMIVFLFFGFASGFFAIYRLQTGRPFAPWLKKKDKAQGSEDGAAKGEEDKQD